MRPYEMAATDNAPMAIAMSTPSAAISENDNRVNAIQTFDQCMFGHIIWVVGRILRRMLRRISQVQGGRA